MNDYWAEQEYTCAPTDPNPIDTEALRRLADAATPGPWPLFSGGEYVGGVGLLVAPDDGGVSPADAAFIAAAREAVPALLDVHDTVRDIHCSVYESISGQTICDECDKPWPCHTIQALGDVSWNT